MPLSEGSRSVKVAVTALLVLACGLVAWVVMVNLNDDATHSVSAPTSSAELRVVTPETVRNALADGAASIDVRTAEEFDQGHLAGARNIDVTAAGFDEKVSGLDMSTQYVVYCASGKRAAKAIEQMTALGFEDLLNGGGFTDLADSGLIATQLDS